MKYISIRAASNLYIGMGYNTIHRHKVYHAAFREFCMMTAKLEHDLGEDIQDDYWKEVLREIKYYRFLLNAAPLPMNLQAAKLLSFMKDNLRRCGYSFPYFVPYIKKMIDMLSILSDLPDNPLLETIAELVSHQEHQTVALLLKESRFFPLVEDVLTTYPALKHIELVNLIQLRDEHCYNQLLIIGPRRWYPGYVFRSPRAKEVNFIHYSWLSDREPAHPIFVKPYTQKQLTGSQSELTVDSYMQEDDNPDESHEEDEDEDEDEGELQQIKRISLSRIRPDVFLLLRTEGGGDYIVPIADRILGEKAQDLRMMQEHWKELLRRAVSTKGLLVVCSKLLFDYGSKRASETNVRNWMSSRTIRPQYDEDFRAIMRLLGLENKEYEYQDTAKQIESAHRKAGFYIRQQLLNQVANADLRELHKKGFMDFELPEADGGSLTAFRIEHISPEVSYIPVSRVGRPITMKDLPWH